MSQSKHVHLQMIQGVINRLSHDSFLLKGWAVVLIAALFALSANSANIQFVYLAYLPSVVFWGLDGYFLRQERLFRKWYDYVRLLPEDKIDFSMDVSQVSDQVRSWLEVVASKTLLAFHGVILLSIILVVGISLSLEEGRAHGTQGFLQFRLQLRLESQPNPRHA